MFDLMNAIHRYTAPFSHDLLDVGEERGGALAYSFINSSHLDVLIVDRNNEPMLVERAQAGTDMSKPGITIKVTRTFWTRKSSTSARHFTQLMGTTIGGLNNIQRDTLNVLEKTPISQSGVVHVCRRFFVPVKEIENNTTLLELQTGLVITTDSSCATALHPESQEFRMKNQNSSFIENQPVGLLYEIVDNYRQHKERFVFVGNGVLRIDHTVDPERACGLYVTEVESRGGARSVSKTVRYDFEEGYKKFGLFLTKEEAETNGNPSLQLQHQVETLRNQLAVRQSEESLNTFERKTSQETMTDELRQRELTQKRQEQLRAMADAEHAVAMQRQLRVQEEITEELREKKKREEIRRDAEYSSYSTQLKTTSDTIKYVPAIIAGVAAVVGGLLFFRK